MHPNTTEEIFFTMKWFEGNLRMGIHFKRLMVSILHIGFLFDELVLQNISHDTGSVRFC